jgi:hypothetical protein
MPCGWWHLLPCQPAGASQASYLCVKSRLETTDVKRKRCLAHVSNGNASGLWPWWLIIFYMGAAAPRGVSGVLCAVMAPHSLFLPNYAIVVSRCHGVVVSCYHAHLVSRDCELKCEAPQQHSQRYCGLKESKLVTDALACATTCKA